MSSSVITRLRLVKTKIGDMLILAVLHGASITATAKRAVIMLLFHLMATVRVKRLRAKKKVR